MKELVKEIYDETPRIVGPGDKGAPSAAAFKASAKTAKEKSK